LQGKVCPPLKAACLGKQLGILIQANSLKNCLLCIFTGSR
jgi:hypothetical protein